MKKRVITVLTIVIALGSISIGSLASASGDRQIVVNGQLLTQNEVEALDAVACAFVPNGRYWLLLNGAWGYEGVPIQAGQLGGRCRTANHHRSLSERGMLFSPYDWVR